MKLLTITDAFVRLFLSHSSCFTSHEITRNEKT